MSLSVLMINHIISYQEILHDMLLYHGEKLPQIYQNCKATEKINHELERVITSVHIQANIRRENIKKRFKLFVRVIYKNKDFLSK